MEWANGVANVHGVAWVHDVTCWVHDVTCSVTGFVRMLWLACLVRVRLWC